jgi:hypothetical protein
MAKIFPTHPGTVSCLNTQRIDTGKGYGNRQVVEGSLANILTRTRQEGRAVIVDSRIRQIQGNPMADKWAEATPELDEYYGEAENEAARLEADRKARE